MQPLLNYSKDEDKDLDLKPVSLINTALKYVYFCC